MSKLLQSWIGRVCAAGVVALAVAGPSSAQSFVIVAGTPRYLPVGPTIVATGIGQLKALADLANDHQQSVHAATAAILAPLQTVSTAQALADNEQITQAAFGETFVAGQSGLWSLGAGGALNPAGYTVVNSMSTAVAPIQSLSLWQADPAQFTATIPPLPAFIDSAEAYIYAAAFGGGPEHIGIAVRLSNSGASLLTFFPLLVVQQNGDIGAVEVGSFLAEFFNTRFSGPGAYLEWLYANVRSVIPPFAAAMSAVESGDGPCDGEALADCVGSALGQLQTDLAAAQQTYDDAVNEIIQEWADDASDGLLGDILEGGLIGGIGGAVGGAAAGGVGALPGAIGGAAVGAIGGAISWLFDTGDAADEAQEDIAEAGEAFQTERCGAMQSAADSIQSCFDEHCPELSDMVSGQLALALAQSGC
jgi:hypothetical protein